MDTQVVVALIGTSGGLMGLAGTWLGAHLNQKSGLQTALQLADVERQKYAHDRLWDARKEAYTAIIVSLNAIYKTADRLYDGFFAEGADGERFFGDESYSRLNIELWERYRSLNTEFEDSTLILSDSFKTLFSEWQSDFCNTDENDIPPEHARQYYRSIYNYLPKIVKAAKAEIAPLDGAIASQLRIAVKSQPRLPWKWFGRDRVDAAGHMPHDDSSS